MIQNCQKYQKYNMVKISINILFRLKLSDGRTSFRKKHLGNKMKYKKLIYAKLYYNMYC